MLKKITKILCFVVIIFIADATFAYALKCGRDVVNPAFTAICDIMVFLQGRIVRSLVTLMFMFTAWSVMSKGSVNWQELLQTVIGIGLFFFPKTFALFALPSYIEGLTGDGFDQNVRYSPDEILTCICPDLR